MLPISEDMPSQLKISKTASHKRQLVQWPSSGIKLTGPHNYNVYFPSEQFSFHFYKCILMSLFVERVSLSDNNEILMLIHFKNITSTISSSFHHMRNKYITLYCPSESGPSSLRSSLRMQLRRPAQSGRDP